MRVSIKRIVVGLCLIALTQCTSRPTFAVGTDPTLTLNSADLLVSTGGVASVKVFGTYSFDDLVQFSFPAGLVAFQGTRFVRYDFDGTIAEGELPSLQDGLSAGEIAVVRAASGAAPAPARLVHLSAAQVQVVLQGFQSGSVSLLVYAVLEGTSFISNTITVELP